MEQPGSTEIALDSHLVSTAFAMRLFTVLVSLAIVIVSAVHAFAQQTGATQNEQLSARVLLSPTQRLSLQGELSAKILEAPLRTGHAFSKGDLLARYDCRQFEAELQIANAAENAAKIEHATKRRLLKHRAVGKDEVLLAATQLERANAEKLLGELRTAQCLLSAPFDGMVVENNVRPFEFPPRDAAMMVILETGALELELVVPSTWLRWMRKGTPFSVEVDETGTSHRATITQISPQVDAVSQTIKIIGKFEKLPANALAGMSGVAYFSSGS